MAYLSVSILLPFTGRLLFLTLESQPSTGKAVDHRVNNGAKPGADTTDMGTENSTDVGAPKSEVVDIGAPKSEAVPLIGSISPSVKTTTATSTPSQSLPKVSIGGNSPVCKFEKDCETSESEVFQGYLNLSSWHLLI